MAPDIPNITSSPYYAYHCVSAQGRGHSNFRDAWKIAMNGADFLLIQNRCMIFYLMDVK